MQSHFLPAKVGRRASAPTTGVVMSIHSAQGVVR